MVSLVDIGDLRKEVELRGSKVEVQGLPSAFIVNLLASSPELRQVMAERAITGEIIEALVAQFPKTIAECIAQGVGKPGDEPTITFVMTKLMPGEWMELLEPIVELTFPKGTKSFVDGLTRLVRHVRPDAPGWAAATKSPAPSSKSSEPAIPPVKHGDTLPGNYEAGSNSSTEKVLSEAGAK